MSDLTDREKTTLDTYNKVAIIWVSKHHTDGFWEKEMKRFHELLSKGKVLEIGAGGARDAKELISFGYEYIGTDISDSLLEIARKELPGQKFYKQSVYKLEFPNEEKFDGFWCSAVLLHVPKTRINEALQRVKLVVKPGAIGFISIKNGEGEHVETELWSGGKSHQRLFSYWSKRDFENILKQNGHTVVDYIYRSDSVKTQWHCFFVKISE